MWLKSIRIGKPSLSWGNSHHVLQPGSFHGYQPFGIGPWFQIEWCPPSKTEMEARIAQLKAKASEQENAEAMLEAAIEKDEP